MIKCHLSPTWLCSLVHSTQSFHHMELKVTPLVHIDNMLWRVVTELGLCGPFVGYKFTASWSLPFMEKRDPYHRTGFRPGSRDLVLRQPRCNYWIISCFCSISSVRNICSDLCRSSVRKGTMSLTDLSWTSTQFLSELVSVLQFLLVIVCVCL